MAFSFKGGVHPDYQKGMTSRKIIEELPAPQLMYFPMLQHIGAPCRPAVAVGDRVYVGSVLGIAEAAVSSPVHSSVSGTVKKIEDLPVPSGCVVKTVVVENDGKDSPADMTPLGDENSRFTVEELIKISKEAGIVGMGGAGFPSHIKISGAKDKIDTLLINGSECEPYLSSDHRAMLQNPEDIIGGVKLLMSAYGLEKAFVCIEDNKKDAARSIEKVAEGSGIKVLMLKTKYPQGGEKQLIYAATRRIVPSGELPSDVGCLVFNVDSAGSLFRAVKYGMPVYRRVVTVAGSAVAKPKVLMARIGTPFKTALEYCGGFRLEPRKIISGGPMMGVAQYTLDVPIIKTTSGILAFTESEDKDVYEPQCIRCGRCIPVCPMRLLPVRLSECLRSGHIGEAEKLSLMDCIECGCCSYVCPARVNLVQEFRIGKAHILRARKGGKK